MLKQVNCPSCDQKNFIQNYNCVNCGMVIREKIANIDLGDTLKYLLINPKFIFRRIFLANHKNYISVFFSLFIIKVLIYHSYFIHAFDLNINSAFSFILINLVLISVLTLIFIKIIVTLIRYISKEKILFKNFLALFIYSFSFFSLSVLVLFPLEWMQFGYFLFSKNPSMFQVNFLKAALIYLLEISFIVISLVLLYISMGEIVSKKVYAFMFSLSIALSEVLIFFINKKIIGVIYDF